MTELWLVDLEAAAPALQALERVTARLADEDRARALRVRDARERRQRVTAYIALRVLLERMAGPAVRGQAFVRGSAGKPHLATGAATFSLSHTGGLALIGVAPAGAIGVDLERARRLGMSARRREHILAVGSGLAAMSSIKPDADDALLRAWCRLEAFAKAHGQGVARVLEEVGVRGVRRRTPTPGDVEAAARALARKAGLLVRDLRMPSGLFAAVAATGPAKPLRPRPFPCEAGAIAAMAVACRTPTR
jgi:4'-phosphopantetheinyl transferase